MAIEDLLVLQGKCKTDPESYRDEFLLRLRHFNSLLVRPRCLRSTAPGCATGRVESTLCLHLRCMCTRTQPRGVACLRTAAEGAEASKPPPRLLLA
jgi:hypothetical protein